MTDDIHEIRQTEAVAAIKAAEDAALKALQVVQHARIAVDMACAGRRGLRPVDLTIQTDAEVVHSIDGVAERRGITRSALLNEWIRARLLVDGNG
jgi:hypothetical protein